jgi:2,3-bisphosphoglycerate-dependent phosphoglycerate mutase
MSEAIPQPGRIDDAAFGTEVLLIRHGESQAVVPGSPESADPPLSERGVEQATALAARLSSKRIDAVWSSHYARARDTARALAEPRGLSVVERRDLREVDLGEWGEGEFRRRAATGDPEYLAFTAAGRWSAIPGGEDDDALRDRVTHAVEEAAASHEGGCIAVVSHGGAINAWLARFTGSHRSMIVAIDNTSVTRLRTDGDRWLVLGVNDRHHLGDPLAP